MNQQIEPLLSRYPGKCHSAPHLLSGPGSALLNLTSSLAGLATRVGGIKTTPSGRRHSRGRALGWLLALLAAGWFAPAAFAATGTCGAATGQGSNGPADYATYCWMDFTNYNNTQATSAAGQAFTFSLPNGGSLSFTLKVTTSSLIVKTVPSWSGAAFGQSAFTGVPGSPVLYQATNGSTTNVSLTNIVLTVGSGSVPYAIVAADAESTNNGENLSFTTNGNAWTLLATMPNGTSTLYPSLTGVGTTTVNEAGVAGTVGAYAFATEGSPTTISSVMVGSGLQGISFGLKFHAADLAVTSSHSGGFNAGGTGSYTLTVHNNGPDAYVPANTITVTDTLPTGLTYTSASGSGWSCGAVGQVVTCTTGANLASGANLPVITLNVNVAYTAPTSVTNSVSVSVLNGYDYNSSNDIATDVTTIVQPDLSTSTKSVLDINGGDANPGDVLQYTITLTESAGVAAINASVTDNMPAGVTSFAVTSTPSGSTNSSTSGGGTNGTGYLNVTGISVPANGSVTIVYDVTVAAGDTPGYLIDNTATVTNPYGNGATPAAPTVTVSQSQLGASGNKILYVYDNQTLTRTPQTGAATQVTVGEASSADWVLTPALQKALVLTPGTNNVSMSLTMRRSGSGGFNTARSVYVQLFKKNGATYTQIGANSGTQNFNSTIWTAYAFTITVPTGTAGNLAAGNQLVLRVQNTSAGGGTRTVDVEQDTGGNPSTITFATSTVINVDSVNVYSAAYPATTTPTGNIYEPNNTVYIRAVVSDPFGSYDVDPATGGTAPKLTLKDANGTTQLSAVNMTQVADSGAATKTFEYYVTGTTGYALSNSAALGYWTPSVTATEGTEGTITHTANGSFDVEAPNLLVMKAVSVVSDPTEGTTRPKAIPGATMQYLINVSNNGKGTSDSNSLVITDPIPANSGFVVGSVIFNNGTPSSGLTLSAANVSYSNNNGTTWTYTPVAGGDGTDPAVTNIRFSPQGSMAGKTGGTAPSFSITFKVIIK